MRPMRWKKAGHNRYLAKSRTTYADLPRDEVFEVFCAGPGQWQLRIDIPLPRNFGLPDEHHIHRIPEVYETAKEAQRVAEDYRKFW